MSQVLQEKLLKEIVSLDTRSAAGVEDARETLKGLREYISQQTSAELEEELPEELTLILDADIDEWPKSTVVLHVERIQAALARGGDVIAGRLSNNLKKLFGIPADDQDAHVDWVAPSRPGLANSESLIARFRRSRMSIAQYLSVEDSDTLVDARQEFADLTYFIRGNADSESIPDDISSLSEEEIQSLGPNDLISFVAAIGASLDIPAGEFHEEETEWQMIPNMSDNLRRLFGMPSQEEQPQNWQAPSMYGLSNSKPIVATQQQEEKGAKAERKQLKHCLLCGHNAPTTAADSKLAETQDAGWNDDASGCSSSGSHEEDTDEDEHEDKIFERLMANGANIDPALLRSAGIAVTDCKVPSRSGLGNDNKRTRADELSDDDEQALKQIMESGVVIDPTLLRSMDVKAEKIESDWKPPSKPGLQNSKPLISGKKCFGTK